MEDRLNQLPKGWVWTRLGEVSEINPKFNKEGLSSDAEVTFLPMKCVDELTGRVDLSITKKLSEVIKGYTSFVEGDLLFAKITPCMENGKTAIAYGLKNGIGFGSTEFHIIRLHEILPRKFFFFFLIQERLRKDAQRNMTGSAGQLRVPVNYMNQIAIPISPLPEQHRIVAKIEELFTRLDAGVEALKRIKVQLKRYRQAVLKYAFEGKLTQEWREANKGKIEPASVLLERIKEQRKKDVRANLRVRPDFGQTGQGGQTHRSAPTSATTNELPELPDGWVWARLGGISEVNPKFNREGFPDDTEVTFLPMRCVEELTGRIDLSITKKLSEVIKGYTSFAEGDLLFAKITPCMENGKTAIAHGLKNGIGFGSTEFHVIRLGELLPSKFFFFFLIQEGLRRDAQRNMTGSAGQLRVPANYMNQIPVPLPPLSEQNKIIEEIERRFSIADNVEKVVDQGLKQAKRLRQSILKRAFEGKLVPQDPTDEPAEKLLERIKTKNVGADLCVCPTPTDQRVCSTDQRVCPTPTNTKKQRGKK